MAEGKTVKFPQIDQLSETNSQLGLNKSASNKSNLQRKLSKRQSSVYAGGSIIEEYEQNPTETIKASQFEKKKVDLHQQRQGYQNNKLIHKKNSVYLNQDNHITYKQAYTTEKNISKINKINSDSAILLNRIKKTQDTVDQVRDQNESILDNNQNNLNMIHDLKSTYKKQGVEYNELRKNIKEENQQFLKNQKHNRKLQAIELNLAKLLEALEQKFVKMSYQRNQYVAVLDKKGNTRRQNIQMDDLHCL